MGLNLEFSFEVSDNWGLEVFTGLLEKSFEVLSLGFFLVSFHLLFADFLLNNFISTDAHTNFPSFVFLDTSFSQNDFNHGRLLDGDKILGVFAPVGIVLDVAFLFAHSILLNFYFPGSTS